MRSYDEVQEQKQQKRVQIRLALFVLVAAVVQRRFEEEQQPLPLAHSSPVGERGTPLQPGQNKEGFADRFGRNPIFEFECLSLSSPHTAESACYVGHNPHLEQHDSVF